MMFKLSLFVFVAVVATQVQAQTTNSAMDNAVAGQNYWTSLAQAQKDASRVYMEETNKYYQDLYDAYIKSLCEPNLLNWWYVNTACAQAAAAPATGSQTAPATGSQTAPATGSQTAPATGSQTAPATGSQTAPATGSQTAPATGSQPTTDQQTAPTTP